MMIVAFLLILFGIFLILFSKYYDNDFNINDEYLLHISKIENNKIYLEPFHLELPENIINFILGEKKLIFKISDIKYLANNYYICGNILIDNIIVCKRYIKLEKKYLQ